uniref:Inositol monophosphatase family protein n=1 Tax=Rhizophora mucronata TaxID=61149 RepID=A0A2P2JZM2_RHIMU
MMGRALIVPSTSSMISTGGGIGIIPFPTSARARRCSSGFNTLNLHFNHNQCGRTTSVHLLIPKPPQPTNPISLTVSAALSSSSSSSPHTEYPTLRAGAPSTGPIPSTQLIQVVESAASTGAQVVMDAVNKPRNIAYKGITDLVTDTDKASEAAMLEVVRKNFGDHLILGEEGGVIGDTLSDYLWCIDPLDGTTNFAHGYPSFAVSVGVLFQGKPAAAAVVEFVGGPLAWNTRMFTATTGEKF